MFNKHLTIINYFTSRVEFISFNILQNIPNEHHQISFEMHNHHVP